MRKSFEATARAIRLVDMFIANHAPDQQPARLFELQVVVLAQFRAMQQQWLRPTLPLLSQYDRSHHDPLRQAPHAVHQAATVLHVALLNMPMHNAVFDQQTIQKLCDPPTCRRLPFAPLQKFVP